jgi:glycosyltransferase involved in cell wall biosynthesis
MVTTSYPLDPSDTTAPFIAAIAEGVARGGRPVDVVLPAHPRLVAGHRAGVNLHPYAYAPVPALRQWGYASSMVGDVRLRRAAYLAAPFAIVATTLAAARVVRRTRSRLVHAHWVIPNGPPAALVAAVAGRPLVISLHGSDVHLAERVRAVGAAARWAFRRAAAVTACSPDLAERAVALGADPARVVVVPYGVDVDQFRPDPLARSRLRAKLGIDGDTAVVVGFGRMVYKKGFHVAIKAMSDLAERADAVLVLAGDGDARPELTRQAQAAGLGERVIFLGHVPRPEVAGLLAAADIFVLPSIHDQAGNVDGLPNVLLEAMASGCAIVASDLAGVRLAMENSHGLLVPEGEPRALSEAIDRLLREPSFRAGLGAAARQRAERALTWRHCIAGYETAYIRALDARGQLAPA